MHKKTLLENIEKIHTTEMGIGRIQKNLEISEEPVSYCNSKLKQENVDLIIVTYHWGVEKTYEQNKAQKDIIFYLYQY